MHVKAIRNFTHAAGLGLIKISKGQVIEVDTREASLLVGANVAVHYVESDEEPDLEPSDQGDESQESDSSTEQDTDENGNEQNEDTDLYFFVDLPHIGKVGSANLVEAGIVTHDDLLDACEEKSKVLMDLHGMNDEKVAEILDFIFKVDDDEGED